jgi:hypothetical protein
LEQHHAKQMAAVEMIRPGGEDLIVDSLGILQLTALVQRQALREQRGKPWR